LLFLLVERRRENRNLIQSERGEGGERSEE